MVEIMCIVWGLKAFKAVQKVVIGGYPMPWRRLKTNLYRPLMCLPVMHQSFSNTL